MPVSDVLNHLLTPLSFGVALFAANVLAMRKQHHRVYRPLALFFLAESVAVLPILLTIIEALGSLSPDGGSGKPEGGLLMRILTGASLPAVISLAPFAWCYVDALTREGGTKRRARALHFAPALFAAVLALVYIALPHDVMAETALTPDIPYYGWTVAVAVGIFGLTLLLYLQLAGYIVAILLRLIAYRQRLKDLFASTEQRELRWISSLAIILLLFWIAGTLNVAVQLLGHTPLQTAAAEKMLSTLVIWSAALWGLRQQPGFLRDSSSSTSVGDSVSPENGKSPKYERSALTPDHARRIAEKVNIAMERDRLHRDPNLSLWDLAKHIGVSSNYVSQTLNETIGETFFDYINRWRVKDAVRAIEETDQTILMIAYDVGFNSRSSFYKAFKKEVGGTPMQLKQGSRQASRN